MEPGDSFAQLPKILGGKLYWSTAMDDCMLEVFLTHLAQGRRTISGWKKGTTYNAIKEALMLNLNMDVTVSQIENRVKTIRSQTMAFKTLNSSCSGFGWDPETMLLTADERVWDEALKANPNLKMYKKKLLPRFTEWMEVLGDNSANGNIQKTCGTADVDAHINDVEDHHHDVFLDGSTNFATINLEEDSVTQNIGNSSKTPELPKTNKFTPRKRKSMTSGFKEEMESFRCTMGSFVDVMKEKNQYNDIIWDKVCAAIYSIDELDEDTQVEALELFSGNHAEDMKRCFLRIPEHKRRGWILKKLEAYYH